jgi:lipopolysaccharide export system protein LptA|tara:strand:- start:368 stop:691 length:324 start_codon:yes stop_codon:yes gene_type:complete
MALDHEAIYKAYPETVVSIDDGQGAFDKDGNSVTLDQSKIDAARTTLNAEAAAVKYQTDRTTNGSTRYDSYGNQLDMIYKDLVAGKFDTTGTWATHIKAVKDANPKP